MRLGTTPFKSILFVRVRFSRAGPGRLSESTTVVGDKIGQLCSTDCPFNEDGLSRILPARTQEHRRLIIFEVM